MTNNPHFKMQPGEKLGRIPNKPIISVIQDGPRSYLWVGNDAQDDMMCFATISGEAALLKLAEAILKGLGKNLEIRRKTK